MYKFNLLYKKSRDGFDCKTFHNKCNGQGPFIVLIKVQSKKTYGGYNPIGYTLRRRQWFTSLDCFTFSFENDQGIHNMKISRVISESCAIYEDCNCFFLYFGGHLFIRKSDQNLYLYNDGCYDNIFGIGLHNQEHVCLPIEEIE